MLSLRPEGLVEVARDALVVRALRWWVGLRSSEAPNACPMDAPQCKIRTGRPGTNHGILGDKACCNRLCFKLWGNINRCPCFHGGAPLYEKEIEPTVRAVLNLADIMKTEERAQEYYGRGSVIRSYSAENDRYVYYLVLDRMVNAAAIRQEYLAINLDEMKTVQVIFAESDQYLGLFDEITFVGGEYVPEPQHAFTGEDVPRDQRPDNFGKRWHPSDEAFLEKMFVDMVNALAKRFKRTPYAVRCKIMEIYRSKP